MCLKSVSLGDKIDLDFLMELNHIQVDFKSNFRSNLRNQILLVAKKSIKTSPELLINMFFFAN